MIECTCPRNEIGGGGSWYSHSQTCPVYIAREHPSIPNPVPMVHVTEAKLYKTMVGFFIDKYHVKHLQKVLNEGGELSSDWKPNHGEQKQAEAEATEFIKRIRK